jgi:transposase
MHIQTILNRIQKYKGFVYGEAQLLKEKRATVLEISMRAHKGRRAACSGCGRKAAGYDELAARRFEFIPLWGIAVVFVYAMRRVQCPRCGVKVEQVPWAAGKSPTTWAYTWFLAGWAKRLSWSEVAEVFHVGWHTVASAVEFAVAWGRAHINLTGITAIGVDEMAWGHGHTYATVVYQINEGRKRLLWVGEKRTAETFRGFFDWLGPERSALIRFVCSDMWQPYLTVIAERISKAVHILDRFHIMTHLSKAIDLVRATEAREMKRKGQEPLLTGSRWCLLKRVANLTVTQAAKLQDLLRYNLKTVRAYLLKEEFQQFWDYVSAHWAGQFLDHWCGVAMRSRIEPVKAVARMLRSHRDLILNWFRAKKEFSCGVVEGLNNKAKLTTRKAYGYSSFRTLEIALYHTLGDLPEPKVTHRFF